MPVVAVDDVRSPAETFHRLQRASTEENEPFSVVGVHVDTVALEISSAIYHVDRDVAIQRRLQQFGWFVSVVHGDWKRLKCGLQVEPIGTNSAIAGHRHPDVVPQGMDGLRQRSGHISQAACLGKRDHFSRQKQNPERALCLALFGDPASA